MDSASRVIIRAFMFAMGKQVRLYMRDGDSLGYHVARVANLVANDAQVDDVDVVVAAILHDVFETSNEDAVKMRAQLVKEFGERVAALVSEVSYTTPVAVGRQQWEIDRAQSLSREAKLITLAEKVDNMRKPTTKNYASWCKSVVDAGLRGTNARLEAMLDELFVMLGVV
jgi:(p)ppGpp synthase/HD superfamily hydrolase